ncbi:hypothetical protein TSUD_388030 [Trifolium subterraneum]|uniref:Gnk2-homologous domain-containing protein n=1 Tax=Trifolium subterraneum TaxID=3900 RepID=A0A2Z6MT03_TRISU|nr:hypothetical protein TSUD_388030 [Trifolium subterraneum]
MCGESESTVNEDTFQTNKKTLLDSLASNVVDHHGFYQTIVGKKSNKVYGTILCRGDISANNCSVCALNSTRVASNDCPKSRDVTIWFRWCFVRYSNSSFSGYSEGTVFRNYTSDIEDPSLVSKVIPFMSGVAAAASVNSFMFHTEVLNINRSEKRYGMAQCTRDISSMDCKNCLDTQLVDFGTLIGNTRRWETHGTYCFMWYNDYQFYFNNGSTLLLSGKKSNRVYGSILCRGDISANNCSLCALNSKGVASTGCPKSRDVTNWFRWCFLRYSNDSFFGEMQGSAVASTNDTDIDDSSLVSQGIPFMSGVAAAASVNSFMFHTEVLNINQSEKRYGMAQCTRDINRKDCRRCLDGQLDTFRAVIGNKRRWEIYGSNCFMWYNDYQFYANVSPLLSAASRPSSCRSLVSGMTFAVSVALLIVFHF